MFDKMRIKATLLQRTMFNDWAVVMLVVFVVKAIMHKYEQNAARLEALRVENEGKNEAMRAENEAKIDTLRAEKDGVIEAMRAEKDAQIAENNLLKLTAKNMTIDGMLTRAREERARVDARAVSRAARRARAFSPAARRVSASPSAGSAARASESD